ncbi:hypothetical protein ATZ33_03880 [Enterococcus silesiacus]|uniref:ABC3 transporter permease protein domain-containing protein n=1 Tax=Enterococcus silesiacus TaxID=332949 RepID=A0A0S3K8B0_9ENTE|nr:hypothetical protein [Enterococcus silesiacus]ALS00541.1 hypothetical protein ATZ33_03880 [Enterococcus silesiacus]OJG91218.1 hypothetical protein RV15_GL000848 [Enterococcus silesiacus]
MKSIRYAFASVSYHKKISFGIGVCSAFFLFILTSILNLIDIEKSFYNQISNLLNVTDYHTNYQKTIQFYSSLYLITLFVWGLLFTMLLFISLKIKKQDMMKWRIMGFSNRFVIKQSILESIIPILAGIITMALFLIVCQHTYEYILIQVRPLLAKSLGVKPVAFFSSKVLIESTPNHLANTASDTHFLSMSISNLPILTIFKAFSRNCLLLLSVGSSITLFLTYFLSFNSKKVFRT